MHFVDLGLILNGDTRPCLCRTDTGELWVIKVHGNPLGTKAIFNEYVVGKLAEMIQPSLAESRVRRNNRRR